MQPYGQTIPPRRPRATIDFETRSACDLKKCGSWIYSLHASTEVMCLSIRLPYWAHGRCEIWHPAYPHLGIEEEGREFLLELFAYMALEDSLVEAHNVSFEVGIWENVCVARMGWPALDRRKWRCSAAKAAVHSIPRALGPACIAMGLPVTKDDEGKKVMLKVSKPRKPLKAERESMHQVHERWLALRADWDEALDGPLPPEPPLPETAVLWHESRELFQILWDYCRLDTLSEEGLSEFLEDLSDEEQQVWFMDLEMNCRGIRVDVAMAEGALCIGEEYCTALVRELHDITSGKVESATSRQKFKAWVNDQGVPLPDTQAATIDKFKAMAGLPPHIHRALHIVKEVNQTSTAKYQTAVLQASPGDDRLRWQVMYHGAGTGRWAGKGLQPHNFKKGNLKDPYLAAELIREGDLSLISTMYGSDQVMETLSGAIRGIMIPSEGYELAVADFSAIEARCVLWLARQMSALDVFYRGEDIYCDMSTGLYGRKITKKDKDERQFGKQAILGLGFEMGFVTFLLTCAKWNIRFSEEMCRRIVGDGYQEQIDEVKRYFTGPMGPVRRVKVREGLGCDWDEVVHELALMRYTTLTYRERYPEVAQMWRDQEAAAIAAVRSPGRLVEVKRGRNAYRVEGRFLKMYLPSGRPLYYPDPKVQAKPVPWNKQETRPVLTFMSGLPGGGWVRSSTYGGMLVENLTQATARDLMAQAMVRCDEHPKYDVLMSVHDELIAECPQGAGDLAEFEAIMVAKPLWADGCPIDAEGWIGPRYRK